MRMYCYWENALYWPAQEKYKVQYIRGIVTELLKKGGRLLLRGEAALTQGMLLTIEAQSGLVRRVPVSERPDCAVCGDAPVIRTLESHRYPTERCGARA